MYQCSEYDPDLYVFRLPGYASGSVSQRYGSEDPAPYINVTDPQHWIKLQSKIKLNQIAPNLNLA